jgi:hypothetical protein
MTEEQTLGEELIEALHELPAIPDPTPSLKLTAKIDQLSTRNALIGVTLNGRRVGTLVIERQHAPQAVGIINAGTELAAVCKRAKDLYDYIALGPMGAACKYGPEHDYGRWTDEDMLKLRSDLETALAIYKAETP